MGGAFRVKFGVYMGKASQQSRKQQGRRQKPQNRFHGRAPSSIPGPQPALI